MTKEWTVADWAEKIEARKNAQAFKKAQELSDFLAEGKHSQRKKRRFNRRPPMGFKEASKSESLLNYGDLRNE